MYDAEGKCINVALNFAIITFISSFLAVMTTCMCGS